VAPDVREADRLAEALETLADPEVREARGAAAQRLAAQEHDVEHVADLYAAALEQAAGGAAVRSAVLSEVAVAAADSGIEPGSPEAAELGARLREARIGE